MINKIIFDDKIVLWWDRQKERALGYKYRIKYAGEIAYTEKTHFTVQKSMVASEKIDLIVDIVDACDMPIRTLAKETLSFAESKNRIDISKEPYCAKGDGKTLNTAAIQKAIDDCTKNDVVYIPEGVFMTGALELHGDMELFVSKGATLQGTDNPEDYMPKIKSRFEGIERECYRSLLNLGEIDSQGGYTSRNVVIRGGGAILGGGRNLMIGIIEKETGLVYDEANCYTPLYRQGWISRGRLLQACNAENIVIADLTVGQAASWNLHFIYSKDIVTFGCKIVSSNVNNGDGVDPDSSENCTIFNCDFDTRDDMIAIKSGKNPEGNIIGRPSRNIRVFDCRSAHGHGLAIGSEISGGIDGVFIWDCHMEKSRCGFEIKGAKERGGYVKNVVVHDSEFSILAIRAVEYNSYGEAAPHPPVFENFRFENITLSGVCLKHNGEAWDESALIVEGFDDDRYCLKNVKLKDITIKHRGTNPKHNISLFFVKGLSMDNIICK